VHRPTLPAVDRQYHRRCSVSRPGSGWSSVGPLRSAHTHPHPPGLLLVRRCHTSLHRVLNGSLGPVTCGRPRVSVRGSCKEALDSAPPSPLLLTEPSVRVACPGDLPGVLPGYTSESTLLEAHFPLRCFQRLMLPNIATEPAGRPTTPPPAVRPARSSRTRASPSQCSHAHSG